MAKKRPIPDTTKESQTFAFDMFPACTVTDTCEASFDMTTEQNGPALSAVAEVFTTFLDNVDQARLQVKLFRTSGDVSIPQYSTSRSSCFDIKAYIPDGCTIYCYDAFNSKTACKSRQTLINNESKIGVIINPGDTLLIPTGLYFDIPEGYKLEIFARSGNALKRKLPLGNNVGKIDEDYTEQLYILLFNGSKKREFIEHGERIAQGEFEQYIQTDFILIDSKPEQKTDRTSGLGHTGRI